jgi:hypothetical protein
LAEDIFKEDEIETQEVLQLKEQRKEMSIKTDDALEYYLDRRHIWAVQAQQVQTIQE